MFLNLKVNQWSYCLAKNYKSKKVIGGIKQASIMHNGAIALRSKIMCLTDKYDNPLSIAEVFMRLSKVEGKIPLRPQISQRTVTSFSATCSDLYIILCWQLNTFTHTIRNIAKFDNAVSTRVHLPAQGLLSQSFGIPIVSIIFLKNIERNWLLQRIAYYGYGIFLSLLNFSEK